MNELVCYLAVAVGAYLIGSIPTGYLVARLKGIDIRQHGSGNIGATNAFRVLGRAWGTFVLLFDACKGAFPVLAVEFACAGTGPFSGMAPSLVINLKIAACVCVVLGHNYTFWLAFKGGKGIATSCGTLLALMPGVGVLALTVFLVLLLTTRYVSVGSICAALSLPVTSFLIYRQTPAFTAYLIFSIILAVLAIWRHKENIQRLFNGTENRVGARKTT